jgi:capsular exopolysaccharide synthesis family protein
MGKETLLSLSVEAAAQSGHSFAPSLLMETAPSGATAESIRALRTHIVAQHTQQGRRALAICGASRGVGRTFIASNLAVALAKIGLKTLLIDADLRHPSMSQFIQPSGARPALGQYLADHRVTFSDVVDTEVMPGLSLIYAGEPVSDAQELLAGERFKQLMDFCLREFDMTIVDTPAANGCADARRISTVVGYSLVIARRDQSFLADVRTLIEQLQADRARIVGTVLNEA